MPKRSKKGSSEMNVDKLFGRSKEAVLNALPSGQDDAETIISSDDIVAYELLKKIYKDGDAAHDLVIEFQQREAYKLIQAMNLINNNDEIARKVGGRTMKGVRRLAYLLEHEAKEKELDKLIGNTADEIRKALAGTKEERNAADFTSLGPVE